MITIIPAIDLKGGKCVRLVQGRADDQKVYSEDPVAMARHWEEQGAEWLHVVDLDGAFQGRPVHVPVIQQITGAVEIPVEVGGGLRTAADMAQLLEAGVERLILGTRACEGPEAVAELVEEFGTQLAIGIDARDGIVQARGWLEDTGIRAGDLARQMEKAGVSTLIFTDTATDGMLTGTNAEAVSGICRAVSCNVIASGGISGVSDIQSLKKLGHANLVGAIVGKALYEGRVTLAELMTAASPCVCP